VCSAGVAGSVVTTIWPGCFATSNCPTAALGGRGSPPLGYIRRRCRRGSWTNASPSHLGCSLAVFDPRCRAAARWPATDGMARSVDTEDQRYLAVWIDTVLGQLPAYLTYQRWAGLPRTPQFSNGLADDGVDTPQIHHRYGAAAVLLADEPADRGSAMSPRPGHTRGRPSSRAGRRRPFEVRWWAAGPGRRHS
jgi:hypothetical protein